MTEQLVKPQEIVNEMFDYSPESVLVDYSTSSMEYQRIRDPNHNQNAVPNNDTVRFVAPASNSYYYLKESFIQFTLTQDKDRADFTSLAKDAFDCFSRFELFINDRSIETVDVDPGLVSMVDSIISNDLDQRQASQYLGYLDKFPNARVDATGAFVEFNLDTYPMLVPAGPIFDVIDWYYNEGFVEKSNVLGGPALGAVKPIAGVNSTGALGSPVQVGLPLIKLFKFCREAPALVGVSIRVEARLNLNIPRVVYADNAPGNMTASDFSMYVPKVQPSLKVQSLMAKFFEKQSQLLIGWEGYNVYQSQSLQSTSDNYIINSLRTRPLKVYLCPQATTNLGNTIDVSSSLIKIQTGANTDLITSAQCMFNGVSIPQDLYSDLGAFNSIGWQRAYKALLGEKYSDDESSALSLKDYILHKQIITFDLSKLSPELFTYGGNNVLELRVNRATATLGATYTAIVVSEKQVIMSGVGGNVQALSVVDVKN